MNLSDEEILAELREDGIDPDAQAADMRRQFDRVALFALVEDVNGKPRPRWEELLEEKVSAGLVGEALSLVRYLLGSDRSQAALNLVWSRLRDDGHAILSAEDLDTIRPLVGKVTNALSLVDGDH